MFHTHTMVALLCGLLCLFYLQQVQQGRNMPELMHVCVRACAVRVRACSHHESFLCLQKNTDFVHFWLGSKSSFTLKKNAHSTTLLLFGKALCYTSSILTFQNVKTGRVMKLNYVHKRHCCIFCALAFVPVSERLHCNLYFPQTQFLIISIIKTEKKN